MNIRAVVLKDELGAIAYVLKRMGYDVTAIYEKEKKSAEICKYNNAAEDVITTDILEVNNADIPYADVVAGQIPYRSAGNLRNAVMMESGNRYLDKYKDILREKRPYLFLFETGKKITADSYFHTFLSEIRNYGYNVSHEVYDVGKMTGTPVVDSKVYILGHLNNEKSSLELPEKYNQRFCRIEEICQSEDRIDDWYMKINYQQISSDRSIRNSFLCWKTNKYVDTDTVSWNTVKIPLVRIDGVIRKITHREIARLKCYRMIFILMLRIKPGYIKS